MSPVLSVVAGQLSACAEGPHTLRASGDGLAVLAFCWVGLSVQLVGRWGVAPGGRGEPLARLLAKSKHNAGK